MEPMTWWGTFTAHLAAVIVGGLKVALFLALFWWFLRKKIFKRILGEVQEQLMPPTPPSATLGAAVAAPPNCFCARCERNQPFLGVEEMNQIGWRFTAEIGWTCPFCFQSQAAPGQEARL